MTSKEQAEKLFSMRDVLTLNAMLLSRGSLIARGMIDPAGRDLDKECGYPEGMLSATGYWQLYAKEGYAARVVNVFPEESWSVEPELYEKEEGDDTPFEAAWKTLEFEHNIWSMLQRADELSGIGRYGGILLGINDGEDLSVPAPGIDNQGNPLPDRPEMKLNYLRVFDETNCHISQVEADFRNPRYGQPLYYQVTFADTSAIANYGGGSPDNQPTMNPSEIGIRRLVHWSRIIHIADNRQSSEVIGMPRMQQVLNRLYDIRKILGGSAEMFWKGAFPGYSFETHPALGTEAVVDQESLADEMHSFWSGLKRYIATQGGSIKSLAPQVSDPTAHLACQIMAICAKLGVPMRIFLGSESGHLASTQDEGTWNRRLMKRQKRYITPYIINPTIRRLMALGVLPMVERFYVMWTDLNAMSSADKADISLKRTQALMQFVAGGVEQMMDVMDFLTKVMEFSNDEALKIIKRAKKKSRKMLTLGGGQMQPTISTQGSGGRLGNPNQAGKEGGNPGTKKNGESNTPTS